MLQLPISDFATHSLRWLGTEVPRKLTLMYLGVGSYSLGTCFSPLIALVSGGGPEDTNVDVLMLGDIQSGSGGPEDTNIDVLGFGDVQSANLHCSSHRF